MSKINRQGSNQILSSSVEYHNFVFLAGLTADDLSKDIKGQTAEVIAKIDAALEVLKASDVPVSKIYSVRDMLQDPQFLARQMFEQHAFSDGSPIKMPAVTPKMSETPGGTRWLGPELGEHNQTVLESLGYSAEQIAQFRADGVI